MLVPGKGKEQSVGTHVAIQIGYLTGKATGSIHEMCSTPVAATLVKNSGLVTLN